METKRSGVISLATALTALGTPVAQAALESSETTVGSSDFKRTETELPKEQANQSVNVGGNLLGFLVTTDLNGTVVAQHVSHSSHASHASHASSVTP